MTKPTQHDHPAYAAMLAVSEATGLPRSFATDLTHHDRKCLANRLVEAPFAWAIYDAGTHLVFAHQQHPSKHSSAALCRIVEDSFEGCRWYWWDGRTLRPVSLERVTELMNEVQEHDQRITRWAEFSAQEPTTDF